MIRWAKYASLLLFGLLAIAGGIEAVSPQGNPRAEWAKSKHANQDRALEVATVEARGAGANHCGRCHSQQGFVAWLPQLFMGDSGVLKKPDGSAADVPYLTSLGLTRDQVQPITCTTCHGTDFALRVQDSTPMLPAGFDAIGVGKGALCMTCHNTRNGRIQWDATDAGRYTAPHQAAEADVLMGKNSFFVNDTINGASPHALFTGDSCVTCHYTQGKEGHTFRPADDSCVSCHGPAMTKEFVQKPTEGLMAQLKTAIERRVLAVRERIAVVRAYDPATGRFTDNFALDGKQISALADILSIAGQISFQFRLADGRDVYTQLGEIRVAPGGDRVFATSDPVVRAAWNYLLIKHDGTKGVHNPSFTRQVLVSTINALR